MNISQAFSRSLVSPGGAYKVHSTSVVWASIGQKRMNGKPIVWPGEEGQRLQERVAAAA